VKAKGFAAAQRTLLVFAPTLKAMEPGEYGHAIALFDETAAAPDDAQQQQ
jgi:hypothetical protein